MRIPMPNLPLTGLNRAIATGGNLFSQMMHPVIQRENMERVWNEHLDDMGLQREGMAHAARNDDIQRAILGQQLQHLKNANDPMYELNQFKMIQGLMGGGSNDNDGTNISDNRNINLDSMKNNPIMRAFFKHKFGYDPLNMPQTAEDKEASALDLFKQKEQIKAVNKTGSGETLTAPIKTKYQNVIGGVSTARPILKKLIEEAIKGNIPGQAIGSLFKRDSQASYKGEISTLLDGVRNAYTIPNTDSGTAKAEDKVLRKSGESDENYAKRLQEILDQMDYREKDARLKLNAGNITASLVHLIGPNGEDYDVPSNEVDAIIAENPGVRRG